MYAYKIEDGRRIIENYDKIDIDVMVRINYNVN